MSRYRERDLGVTGSTTAPHTAVPLQIRLAVHRVRWLAHAQLEPPAVALLEREPAQERGAAVVLVDDRRHLSAPAVHQRPKRVLVVFGARLQPRDGRVPANVVEDRPLLVGEYFDPHARHEPAPHYRVVHALVEPAPLQHPVPGQHRHYLHHLLSVS